MFRLALFALVAAEKAKLRIVGSGESQSTDPKHVKIATWNMYDHMNKTPQNQKERFCFGVNDVFGANKWDIVMIQEVFRTDDTLNACTFSAKWHAALGPRGGGWLLLNSGLLIMSKFPIAEAEFLAFDRTDLPQCPDSVADKGILFAKVAVGDHHFFIFNTHTQGLYHSTEWGYNDCQYEKQANMRKKQIKQIFEFMSKTLDAHRFDVSADKLFLMGDFNIDPWGPNENQEFPTKLEYDFLLFQADIFSKRFKDLLLQDVSRFPKGSFTFPANRNPKEERKKGEKVDYIFHLLPRSYETKTNMCTIINHQTSEAQRAKLTDSEWVRDFMTLSDHKAIEYEVRQIILIGGGRGFKLFIVWFTILAIFLLLTICAWKRKKGALGVPIPRRVMLATPYDNYRSPSRIPPVKEAKEMRFHVLNS